MKVDFCQEAFFRLCISYVLTNTFAVLQKGGEFCNVMLLFMKWSQSTAEICISSREVTNGRWSDHCHQFNAGLFLLSVESSFQNFTGGSFTL